MHRQRLGTSGHCRIPGHNPVFSPLLDTCWFPLPACETDDSPTEPAPHGLITPHEFHTPSLTPLTTGCTTCCSGLTCGQHTANNGSKRWQRTCFCGRFFFYVCSYSFIVLLAWPGTSRRRRRAAGSMLRRRSAAATRSTAGGQGQADENHQSREEWHGSFDGPRGCGCSTVHRS